MFWSKPFFTAINVTLCFLTPSLSIFRITFLESFLHPWNETNLVMVHDFSVFLNSVYKNLRFFAFWAREMAQQGLEY